MKWVIFMFCLVIGFASLYYGIKLFRLYRRVIRWPKVSAKILSKAVVPRRLASGSRASKTVSISYEYVYEGLVYQGNTVFIVELLKGEKGFLQKQAEQFLEKIENTAEIFVDPEHPERSLMFCDGAILYLFMITAGIAMLISGLLSL